MNKNIKNLLHKTVEYSNLTIFGLSAYYLMSSVGSEAKKEAFTKYKSSVTEQQYKIIEERLVTVGSQRELVKYKSNNQTMENLECGNTNPSFQEVHPSSLNDISQSSDVIASNTEAGGVIIQTVNFLKQVVSSILTLPERKISPEEAVSVCDEIFTVCNTANEAITQGKSNLILQEEGPLKISMQKASKFLDNIDKNNLISTNDVIELFKNINHHLSYLNTEQLGIIVHISGSLTILFCLCNIIFAMFGSKLIERFKLNIKFPKLAKLINLKQKMYTYTIIFNSFLIVLTCFLTVFLNLFIFYSLIK